MDGILGRLEMKDEGIGVEERMKGLGRTLD